MKLIKSILIWIVAFILFLIALVAASYNSEAVSLTFLEWQTPEFALSFWVLGAFVLGVATASLFNLWANTKLRLRARQANKHVDRAQQDLDKIRADATELTGISE